jgi:hypothetical protein
MTLSLIYMLSRNMHLEGENLTTKRYFLLIYQKVY